MEFVIVEFPIARGVNMDGAPNGFTNQLLTVQAGTHIFDLGLPIDYNPASCQHQVVNTDINNPMRIPFAQGAFVAMAEAASVTRRSAAPRRKAKSTRAKKARKPNKKVKKIKKIKKTKKTKKSRKTGKARPRRRPKTATRRKGAAKK